MWLAPRIREQAGDHIGFPGRELDSREGYPWDAAIDTLPPSSGAKSLFDEAVHADRYLLLNDMQHVDFTSYALRAGAREPSPSFGRSRHEVPTPCCSPRSP